jgi:hypothetical protein
MASYWIVVSRGNPELFELLSVAFRGRTGFNVIVDRRGTGAGAPAGERRLKPSDLGPDEFIVAERAEQSDQAESGDHGAEEREHRHTGSRVPVRRRRLRPSEHRPKARAARPLMAYDRLFTL